jgi:hypothetical protein
MAFPLRKVLNWKEVKAIRRPSRGFHGHHFTDHHVQYELACGHSVTLLRKAHTKGGGHQRVPVELPCPVCGPA